MATTFLFDEVLYAFRMKAPALRRWIYSGLVGNTAKGEAREGRLLIFSCHDIAVLALVKPMTEFGVPVSVAHKIAVRELKDYAASDDDPPSAWWTAWPATTELCVLRKLTAAGKPAWSVARFDDVEAADDEAVAVLETAVHLAISPRPLIRAALTRAMAAAEARMAQADRRRRA